MLRLFDVNKKCSMVCVTARGADAKSVPQCEWLDFLNSQSSLFQNTVVEGVHKNCKFVLLLLLLLALFIYF